jgi:hypothetical protein
MPSSRSEIISPALAYIEAAHDVNSVLDVGIGFGKWGVLCREYLDVWKGRVLPAEWQVRIDGVEAFAAYRNPAWAAYSDVYVAEVRQWLSESDRTWDVVLMMDVLEHFQHHDGAALLADLLGRSRLLIVATPTFVRPQGVVYGNVYERHVAAWSPDQFAALCRTCAGVTPKQTIHGKTALWAVEVAA